MDGDTPLRRATTETDHTRSWLSRYRMGRCCRRTWAAGINRLASQS